MNVDFALKLRIYRSYKRFICLERILKNLCTRLHTQFNYLTLPVTPFNRTKRKKFLFEINVNFRPLFTLFFRFLGGQFTTYGTGVISQTEGNFTTRGDHLNVVFPKVRQHTFTKILETTVQIFFIKCSSIPCKRHAHLFLSMTDCI